MRGKIIGAFPKFFEIGMLLQEVTKVGSMWILALLYALQLEKNAFTLKFEGNFRSTIMICNLNYLKHLNPKTFEGPKNLSTFQVPSSKHPQPPASWIPSSNHYDPTPKLSKFPKTSTPSKFQAFVTQHSDTQNQEPRI